MRYGDEDRRALLDDFGLLIQWGNNSTKGIFDEEERVDLDDSGTQVVIRESVLIVTAEDFESGAELYGLAVDDAIMVDGVDYEIRDINLIDDGAFKRLVVAPA